MCWVEPISPSGRRRMHRIPVCAHVRTPHKDYTRWYNTLKQNWFMQWYRQNVVLMLFKRLQRCFNIKTTLGRSECVRGWILRKHVKSMLFRAEPTLQTVVQHLNNIGSLSRIGIFCTVFLDNCLTRWMLFQCWSIVADGSPTLKKHWITVPISVYAWRGGGVGVDLQGATSVRQRCSRKKLLANPRFYLYSRPRTMICSSSVVAQAGHLSSPSSLTAPTL